MLATGADVWSVRPRLSSELYAQLRGQFKDNTIREVLLAAAGVKVSRACLSEGKFRLLHRLAAQHNFSVLASQERYIHRCDAGKGGFSNTAERIAGPDEANGLRNVYIGSDGNLLEPAQFAEEASDHQLFGTLLGIPSCCREAYVRCQPVAQIKQSDLVPLVLDNTSGAMPYDPWLNCLAKYFGRTLLSFFPCSFQCELARTAAKNTFEMLAECDREWACSFFDLQYTNILYTEYQGIHLFRRPFVDGSIHYRPADIISTEATDVNALILRGERVEVHGKHQVSIYRGMDRIGILKNEDISMFVFRGCPAVL